MTLAQLEEAIIKLNTTGEEGVNVESVVEEMSALSDKKNAGSISRDEEIVLWMFLKRCERTAAERWTAIMRGEITLGKTEDGLID
ncbi:MAG: hypothetical protein HUU02_03930 [Bacteroidetes bacterium]|nr:hypothetical protein [Bacteroidota bacterium]